MKYYLWLNNATQQNWYWNRDAQNWTSDPLQATLFNSRESAETEALCARWWAKGAAVLCRQYH